MSEPSAQPVPRPPGAVARAAALVGLEAVVLVVFGVVYAVAAVTGDAETVVGAEVGAALIFAAGVLLALVARALYRQRAWSRSPVVVVQLLTLLTGLSLLPTGAWPGALVAVALAAAVLYQLATPEARLALRRE